MLRKPNAVANRSSCHRPIRHSSCRRPYATAPAVGHTLQLLRSPIRDSSCHTEADWKPAAPRRRRVLGVPWRCPAVLWGPSTPNSTRVSWKTLILKNWPICPVCMWICGGSVPCGPSALLATKKASFRKKTCRLVISLITGQKIADFSKKCRFLFLTLYGSKRGVLGQKTVFSGV